MKTLREKLLHQLLISPRGYPTWWTKERLNDGTTNAQARAEFLKMEKEGLVSRQESYSNCIIWQTPEGKAVQLQIESSWRYKWCSQYMDRAHRMSAGKQKDRFLKAAIAHQREGAKLSAEARRLMRIE